MKVSIVRGGGLAGIVTRTELDADRLPPDAARTLEDDHGRRTARFGDTTIPQPVRALVEWADARPERTMEIVPQAGSSSTV